MKILHTVESYYPSVGGMPEVVKQISERLVKLGHEVTVATSSHSARTQSIINGVRIVGFNNRGNYFNHYLDSKDIDRYRNFLREGNFDVMVNFAAQQWATDLCLDLLPELKCRKVFVPTGFSGLYLDIWAEYFGQMKQWMKHYDMNVFLSNDYRDINFARENGIDRRMIIPNGAAADEFLKPMDFSIREKLSIDKNDFFILHVGSHTGIKGHKEAISVFEKARIQNAVLLIVGNYPDLGESSKQTGSFGHLLRLLARLKLKTFLKALATRFRFMPLMNCPDLCLGIEEKLKKSRALIRKGKKILVRTLSREETVAAYREADLFLFPSNIECSPIVLFECMAAKTAFLVTDVGNSREIIEWSKAGQLLPTRRDKRGYSYARIPESVRMLETLYNDKGMRDSLASEGHSIWEREFSWEVIAKKYETLYLDLIRPEVLETHHE